jgi:hypothetical protein
MWGIQSVHTGTMKIEYPIFILVRLINLTWFFLMGNHSENSDALGGFAPPPLLHPPKAITSQKPAI